MGEEGVVVGVHDLARHAHREVVRRAQLLARADTDEVVPSVIAVREGIVRIIVIGDGRERDDLQPILIPLAVVKRHKPQLHHVGRAGIAHRVLGAVDQHGRVDAHVEHAFVPDVGFLHVPIDDHAQLIRLIDAFTDLIDSVRLGRLIREAGGVEGAGARFALLPVRIAVAVGVAVGVHRLRRIQVPRPIEVVIEAVRLTHVVVAVIVGGLNIFTDLWVGRVRAARQRLDHGAAVPPEVQEVLERELLILRRERLVQRRIFPFVHVRLTRTIELHVQEADGNALKELVLVPRRMGDAAQEVVLPVRPRGLGERTIVGYIEADHRRGQALRRNPLARLHQVQILRGDSGHQHVRLDEGVQTDASQVNVIGRVGVVLPVLAVVIDTQAEVVLVLDGVAGPDDDEEVRTFIVSTVLL